MKSFLAIYTGGNDSTAKTGWDTLSPEEQKALATKGVEAWGEWMKTHKDAIVVEGGPLGKTKRTGADGISDMTNTLCGYVVVKASSHEEAANMFIGHPHFSIFPGDGVEIMECLSIPI